MSSAQGRRNFFKRLLYSGAFVGLTGRNSKAETLDRAVDRHYDVLVCGGGPGGVCAAVAAAREGKKVLLIEQYGFLGGMATAGLVEPFMPYETGGKVTNAGIFNEVCEGLKKNNGFGSELHKSECRSAAWQL